MTLTLLQDVLTSYKLTKKNPPKAMAEGEVTGRL